jgi:hypothetical protein
MQLGFCITLRMPYFLSTIASQDSLNRSCSVLDTECEHERKAHWQDRKESYLAHLRRVDDDICASIPCGHPRIFQRLGRVWQFFVGGVLMPFDEIAPLVGERGWNHVFR